jgi:hypothetical protein
MTSLTVSLDAATERMRTTPSLRGECPTAPATGQTQDQDTGTIRATEKTGTTGTLWEVAMLCGVVVVAEVQALDMTMTTMTETLDTTATPYEVAINVLTLHVVKKTNLQVSSGNFTSYQSMTQTMPSITGTAHNVFPPWPRNSRNR